MNFNNARFIKSAVSADGCPKDGLPNIVFVGRSNVGKSSVINKILNRKNFARSSSAPGKTAQINFFVIDDKLYFVDLPGYGYAKVSKAEKQRWGMLMEDFFAKVEISLGVLVLDIRHDPTQDDKSMISWFLTQGVPFVIVLNKSDKLKQSEINEKETAFSALLNIPNTVKVIPFSAQNGDGKQPLLKEISTHTENV